MNNCWLWITASGGNIQTLRFMSKWIQPSQIERSAEVLKTKLASPGVTFLTTA